MIRIDWARSAMVDLAAIYEHIAQDSPRYALIVVDRLTNRTKQIASFPLSSQAVPEYNRDDIREVIEYSYRIVYLAEPERIYIIAVIHGARLLPDNPNALGKQ